MGADRVFSPCESKHTGRAINSVGRQESSRKRQKDSRTPKRFACSCAVRNSVRLWSAAVLLPLLVYCYCPRGRTRYQKKCSREWSGSMKGEPKPPIFGL